MSAIQRNSRVDNIKGFLIFLVVFGHLVETHIEGHPILRPLWIFLYLFHMPMFVFISGMFSKADLDEKQSGQLIKNIFVPLLTFEFIYEGLEFLLSGHLSVYSGLFAPYWMLWYLTSLLCWRLLLPLFARLQFPVIVAVSIAMIATYSETSGYFLSISRTLTFFPFFLLGWKYGRTLLNVEHKAFLPISIGIVASTVVGCFLLKANFDYRWLYGSYSLNRLGMANLTGSTYQLLQYLSCTIIGLAVLHLLSRRDLGLSQVGKRSMYVFLWHGLALIVLHQTGLLDKMFSLNPELSTAMSLIASIVIVWLSSRLWSEQFTQKYVLYPLCWLLVKPASEFVATTEVPAVDVKDKPATTVNTAVAQVD